MATKSAPVKLELPAALAALKKPFTLPKLPGQCADYLYATRELRYAVQRWAEELEKREKAVREHLVQTLPKSHSAGAVGLAARATLETVEVPTVEDWPKYWAHIKKTGDFSLLEKRAAKAAIEERWADGKVVPGVGRFTAVKVSVVKL